MFKYLKYYFLRNQNWLWIIFILIIGLVIYNIYIYYDVQMFLNTQGMIHLTHKDILQEFSEQLDKKIVLANMWLTIIGMIITINIILNAFGEKRILFSYLYGKTLHNKITLPLIGILILLVLITGQNEFNYIIYELVNTSRFMYESFGGILEGLILLFWIGMIMVLKGLTIKELYFNSVYKYKTLREKIIMIVIESIKFLILIFLIYYVSRIEINTLGYDISDIVGPLTWDNNIWEYGQVILVFLIFYIFEIYNYTILQKTKIDS